MLEHWRLCDPLSLEDAAALLAGYDPEEINRQQNDTGFDQNHPFLYTMETSLRNAVLSNRLQVMRRVSTGKYHHIRMAGDESEGWWEPVDELSLSGTLVAVDDLKNWLTSMGVDGGFFFTEHEGIEPGSNRPDPMNKNSKFYAPKLAAAIEAWETLQQDPKLQDANAVVKEATDWLTENAERLNILWTDPKTGETIPPKSTIEAMAKIINWNDKGGVNKTPQ